MEVINVYNIITKSIVYYLPISSSLMQTDPAAVNNRAVCWIGYGIIYYRYVVTPSIYSIFNMIKDNVVSYFCIIGANQINTSERFINCIIYYLGSIWRGACNNIMNMIQKVFRWIKQIVIYINIGRTGLINPIITNKKSIIRNV